VFLIGSQHETYQLEPPESESADDTGVNLPVAVPIIQRCLEIGAEFCGELMR